MDMDCNYAQYIVNSNKGRTSAKTRREGACVSGYRLHYDGASALLSAAPVGPAPLAWSSHPHKPRTPHLTNLALAWVMKNWQAMEGVRKTKILDAEKQ